MSIKDRLKTVIEHKGLSLKAFSDLTEIPYRSIQNYLRDERDPNLDALVKIGTKTDINLHWLITGIGAMLRVGVDETTLSEKEVELLLAYKQCDISTQYKINLAIVAIAK
ncbi:MAG: helix-turn-helix transcriptional regulator [Pasteurella oralis]|uniref:helix-turn-helix domain-containing protein n=1 Tax=Pasteurella oralis TaxID=1071947 RepID=UPI00270555DB|nr:helix-turn-helix transcriptional regulator [Pasteurella oralis]